MNLGENIYRFRTERNMSQGDLADSLDVSRQSVSKWENNSATPELEKLLKMTELFGVTLDQLVGREPPQPPQPEIVVRSGMEPRQVVGIVLLSIGLAGFMLLTLWAGLLLSSLLCLPLIIVGAVLLLSRTDLLFKCCWALFAVYAPLDYLFIFNYIGGGAYTCMIVVGVWFAILLTWSAILIHKDKLSVASRRLMIGAIVFALVFGSIMYWINMRSLQLSFSESIEEYRVEID